MPRPRSGYKNAAGRVIPGVGDVNGRFMDRSRLLYWAFNRGKAGFKTLYDNIDLNIGACVHMMAELHLKGRPLADIEFYAKASLRDPEDLNKAITAFAAFCAWRARFHVDAYQMEVSLISERLQVGGTPDTIAYIRGGLGLLDFKTSAKGEVYEDMIMQLAGYALLWEECRPDEPLTAGYHLILLPKEGGKPVHHEWTREQLEPFCKKFRLYRAAYDIDTDSAKAMRGIKVQPSERPAEKPRVRVKVVHAPMPTPSMAELLRGYGHVGAAS